MEWDLLITELATLELLTQRPTRYLASRLRGNLQSRFRSLNILTEFRYLNEQRQNSMLLKSKGFVCLVIKEEAEVAITLAN